ncbi:MAG: type IV-A pilus assembly ATPase PilB [Pseudomonadota bacterium]
MNAQRGAVHAREAASEPRRKMRLGELLVQEGLITPDQLRIALTEQKTHKLPIGRLLVRLGFVTEATVRDIMARTIGKEAIDLSQVVVDAEALKLVPEEFARRHRLLPIAFDATSRVLLVAVTELFNVVVIDQLRASLPGDMQLRTVLAGQAQLEDYIDQFYGHELSVDGILREIETGELDWQSLQANDDEYTQPIVRLVGALLIDAVKRGASDIHFEPYESVYRVRLRMDGILRPVASPPHKLNARIASRLKVMAGLDIAERRVPQDGRIKLNISKTKAIDFRVSTCPTLFGEKIVLRILDASAAKLGIEKLGYEEDQKQLFLDAISKPYGMVLVTGPTGSGKTVSLYTALNILNTDGVNISTVEDPVEIRVPGINQVQQNAKKGMTFAAALRSFLRQDPDIIMVGEIRDLETAEIAVKAAQTGHMVLSTLHTNDAPQTVARLMNMGIAPYNITSSVTLIIAQRLARRLHDCKRPLNLPVEALVAEGFSEAEARNMQMFEAVGCSGCNDGYKGRVGIYQVMPMAEQIQKIILSGGNALQIAAAAKEAGIRDLRASALKKVRDGLTSLAEINRVTKD